MDELVWSISKEIEAVKATDDLNVKQSTIQEI